MRIRIPGWAQGIENPFGLYNSETVNAPALKINGKKTSLSIKNGYAEIKRKWKQGDRVELELPIQPRIITAHSSIHDLSDKFAIASGPLIYCIENEEKENHSIYIPVTTNWEIKYKNDLIKGSQYYKK